MSKFFSVSSPRPLNFQKDFELGYQSYIEIPPFFVDSNGEVLNKTNKPILKEGPFVNVYDKIQSYKDECDIYSILGRVSVSGDLSLLNQREGSYIDSSSLPKNVHDANDLLKDSEKDLSSLDESLKTLILNDSNESLIQKAIDARVRKIISERYEPVKSDSKEEVK